MTDSFYLKNEGILTKYAHANIDFYWGPWTSVNNDQDNTSAFTNIPVGKRIKGLKFGVVNAITGDIEEYMFTKDNATDNDIIKLVLSSDDVTGTYDYTIGRTTSEQLSEAIGANKIITIGTYIASVGRVGTSSSGYYVVCYTDEDGVFHKIVHGTSTSSVGTETTKEFAEVETINSISELGLSGVIGGIKKYQGNTMLDLGGVSGSGTLGNAIKHLISLGVHVDADKTNNVFSIKNINNETIGSITLGTNATNGAAELNFVAGSNQFTATLPNLDYDSSRQMLKYIDAGGDDHDLIRLSNLQIKTVFDHNTYEGDAPTSVAHDAYAVGDLALVEKQDTTTTPATVYYDLTVVQSVTAGTPNDTIQWQPLGSINNVSLVADQVEFDNSTNGFDANNVQGAIEETQWSGKLLVGKNMNVAPAFNNHTSGYINESGANTNSGNCKKKMYKNNGYSRVLVKGYSTNNVNNTSHYLAIAFYSGTNSTNSNAPDYTTYIDGSGVAYTKANLSKEYFEAEVPSAAQWIVVSYNTNGGESEVYFTIDNSFKDIVDRTKVLEDGTERILDSIAVKTENDADGSGNHLIYPDTGRKRADSYYYVYFFKTVGCTSIKVRTYGSAEYPGIAFYSVDTYKTDGTGYISDATVLNRTSVNHGLDTEVSIPENAKLAAVVINSTTEKPYVRLYKNDYRLDVTNRLSDVEHVAGSEYDKIKRNAVLSIADSKTLGKGIKWDDGKKYALNASQGYWFLIEGVTHIYAKILNITRSCANIAFYRKADDGEESAGAFEGYVYMQDVSVQGGSNEYEELELISEIPSDADLVCVTSYRTYEQQDNEPIVEYTPEIYLSCGAPSVRLNTQIKQNTENVDAIQSRLITQFPFACHLSLSRTVQKIRFKPRNNAIIRVQYSFDSWSLTNTSAYAAVFYGVKKDGTSVNLAKDYEGDETYVNGVNFPNNSKYSIRRSSLKGFPLGYGLKREDSIIFPTKDVNSDDEFVEYYLEIKGESGSEVDVALIDDGLNNIVDRCGGALYLQNKLQSLHKLLKSSGDKDPVTLLYFSDIHNANDALKQIMDFYNLKGISSYIEDVLCGGDCVADHSVEYITEEGVTTTVKMEYPFYDTDKATAKATAVDDAEQAYNDVEDVGDNKRDAENALALAQRAAVCNVYDSQNVLIAVGNHDCLAKYYPENTNSELTAAELYDDTISNLGAHLEYLRDNKGIVLGEGATYYYKDYTTVKTVDGVPQTINCLRLIVLDCMHKSSEQLSWFENVLSDAAKDEIPVIVCEHYKPSSQMTYIDSPFSSLEDSNTDSYLVGENAAKDTTSYLAKVDNAINNGLDFVCWLYGHEHKDYFGYLTRHTNQYAVCIGKTAPPENDSNRDWTLLPSYVKLNMISVQPSKKILTVWRIGSNGDIFGREKELIVFDYGQKKIISNY